MLTQCLPHTTSWFELSTRSLKRALKTVIRQIQDLHAQGITHNDLALKNIVVNTWGEAGLIDFEDAVSFDETGTPSITCDDCPREFWPDDDWFNFLTNFLPLEYPTFELEDMSETERQLALDLNRQAKRVFPIVWQMFQQEGLGVKNLKNVHRFVEGKQFIVKKIRRYQ